LWESEKIRFLNLDKLAKCKYILFRTAELLKEEFQSNIDKILQS